MAALAGAVGQPPLLCYTERMVFRALMATAGWTGATVIRPARAELTRPQNLGIKGGLPRPRRTFYLCGCHTHVDARKHTLHGDAARCWSHKSSHGSHAGPAGPVAGHSLDLSFSSGATLARCGPHHPM
jgi:hypothetical protein